jgi:uncharacterized protein
MKRLTATLCLTIAVLLGSAGVSFALPPSASEPVEGLCLAGKKHSHVPIFGKCWSSYESGNYATALREWTPLAEQGDASAQFNLGKMYVKGHGVPKDTKTAVKWLRLAAEQGQPIAQLGLSAMYALGRGVLQDKVYAHLWANLAASNGIERGEGFRDLLEKKMTPAEISTAQKLARECVRKKYKGC